MDARTMSIMTVAVLLGVVLLLVLNFTRFFTSSDSGPYLARVEIKGVSIVSNKQEYPLSYDQQNSLISLINKAILVKKIEIAEKGTKPNFDKIVVHRFDQPNLEITPIKYVGTDLVFEQLSWNPTGWLRDITHGDLKALITKIVEPQGAAPEKPITLEVEPENPFIPPSDVKSVALTDFEGKEQTLNLEHQKQLIGWLNKATPIDKTTVLEKGTKTNVDKIIIKRNHADNIVLTAVAYIGDELVFSEALWSSSGLLKDNSQGALKTLISNYM